MAAEALHMKVFISWSGDRSRAVADTLRVWLKDVIQAVDPWISGSNIEKGTRGGLEITKELEGPLVGIFCLTRENFSSPWLLFEAGAISKHRAAGHVCTYLIGLTSNDVEEPLSQFQHTRADKEDTLQLLQTINSLLDIPLEVDLLERVFDQKCPELEQVIENLPSTESDQTPIRASAEILQDVQGLARVHSRELQQIRGQIAVSQQEPNSYSAYFRTQQELLRRFAVFSGTGELTQPIYVPGLDAVTEIAKQ